MKISGLFQVVLPVFLASSISHAGAKVVKAEYSTSAKRSTLVVNVTGDEASDLFTHLNIHPDSSGEKRISTNAGALTFACQPTVCVITDLVAGDLSAPQDVSSPLDSNLYSRESFYDGGIATEVGGVENSGVDSHMNMKRIIDPQISNFVEAFTPNEATNFSASIEERDAETGVTSNFIFTAIHGVPNADVRQMYILQVESSKFQTVP